MFRRPVSLGFLPLLFLAAGCGASGASSAGGAPSSGDVANAPDREISGPKSIEFTEGSLTFVPSASETVGVEVAPPGVYDVRFALVGDARDAYLDQGDVTTSPDGTASVVLTAPSAAATFTLRASVDQLSADLSASAGTSFASLEVIPEYAGSRTVTTWVATVSTGSTCQASTAIPPPDGQLQASAAPPAHPVVDQVPVGSPLTVTIRAGHFVGGCAELPSIAGDAKNTVSVAALDRPLQMDGVELPLHLGITPSQDFSSAWDALADSIVAAFVDDESSDASALLDAMYDSTPTIAKGIFSQTRALSQWDGVLGSAITSKLGANGVRALVEKWISLGLPVLSSHLIDGALSSAGAPEGTATIRISAVGSADPASAGVPASIPVSWTPEPDDQVVFGGSVSLVPVALATTLALGPAKADAPSAKTVADALSTLVCSDVASALVGSSGTGVAYFECDSPCIVSKCGEALSSMWARAAASAPLPQTLGIAASGTAGVDDDAAPASIDGTWVGSVTLTQLPTRVGGPAVGGTSGPE